MPFIVTIPDDAEAIIVELEQKYARAATGIRLLWGQREADEFFDQLLCYNEGFGRAGFELPYLKMIQSLREIHQRDYMQYMSLKEKLEREARQDAWSRAITLK